MRRHEHRPDCCCHRVVLADGKLGGYVGNDLEAKCRQLIAEGVTIEGERVDLSAFKFSEFATTSPLATLTAQQHDLVREIQLSSAGNPIKQIGGVDVSYVDPREGVAAYTLIDAATAELVWSTTIRRPVLFPYITSYLAYRELPILLELIDVVRTQQRLADIVLVDGSGIMHPRGAGVASQLGIVAAIRTVGVTKKHLFGNVSIKDMEPGERRMVIHEQQPIGAAIRRRSKSKRPLFVSPGHRSTLAEAIECVESMLQEHNLPEPIYWADRLSRQAARSK